MYELYGALFPIFNVHLSFNTKIKFIVEFSFA